MRIFTSTGTAGRVLAAAAVLLSFASVSVAAAPNAFAYANGCTTADGPAGSHICVTVHGSGVHADSIFSAYFYAPNGAASGSNVCDRHHEASYYLPTGRVIREIDPPGCVNSGAVAATGDYASFLVNRDLAPNTPVCTRAKNSATNQQWTPYACEKIIP